MGSKRARYWVLREQRGGNGYWLREWASEVQCFVTPCRGEGLRFPSKRKALQHPAAGIQFTPEAVR